MCIPRTTLTRHHSLTSSFVSCQVCFPCSFAPCYEVIMMPEPFKEFRYSGCGTSSHGDAANCLVSVVRLSFDLALQLCLASLAVGTCGWLHLELLGPCKNRRTAPFCPVPGVSRMMMEVYVCGLLGFELCTCYFSNLFLGSE